MAHHIGVLGRIKGIVTAFGVFTSVKFRFQIEGQHPGELYGQCRRLLRNTLRRVRERHRLARRTNVEGPLWCNTRVPIVVARSLLGVPRISTPFQWIPADPPLLSILELLKHNCRFSGRFFRRWPPIHLFLLCMIARLPDYPVGMVWESSGVEKGLSSSIGKQNSRREPGGRVFEVFTESPTLSAAWTLVSTLLRTVG